MDLGETDCEEVNCIEVSQEPVEGSVSDFEI
jgi:hypothetical protein